MKKYFFLLVLFSFFSTYTSYAATCTAIVSGNWEDPSIWSCGSVPGNGDDVIIPFGIEVRVTTSNYTGGGTRVEMNIFIDGILSFDQGGAGGRPALFLDCPSSVTIGESGIISAEGNTGNNNVIEIDPGNNTIWSDGGCRVVAGPRAVSCNANNGNNVGTPSSLCDDNSITNFPCILPVLPPTEPVCPMGNTEITGSVDVNGTNDQQIDYFYDDGGTIPTLSASDVGDGSIVTFCSSATITNLDLGNNEEPVTIIVKSGTTLIIDNGFTLDDNVSILNYGTVIINGDVDLTNRAIRLVNATPTSLVDINGTLTIDNEGTSIFNLGSNDSGGGIIVDQLDITSQADEDGIVLGENSSLDVGTFNSNDRLNSICGAQTCAEIDIQTVTPGGFTQDMTAFSEVRYCDNDNPVGGDVLPGAATAQCPVDCNILLPVSLTFFNVESKEHDVILRWQTASEYNNSQFFIERSSNGSTFHIIGSLAGQGTTNKVQNYQWTDTAPLEGSAYYRLKQVDADGNYSTSMVRYVKRSYSQTGIEMSVYPNPAKDKLTIILSPKLQQVRLELIDLSGNVIIAQNIAELSQGSITWNGLEGLKGFYVLRVYHQQFVQQHKILFR